MLCPYCLNVAVFNRFGKVGFEMGYLLNRSIRYDPFDHSALWSRTNMISSFCLFRMKIIPTFSMINLKNRRKELIVQFTVL